VTTARVQVRTVVVEPPPERAETARDIAATRRGSGLARQPEEYSDRSGSRVVRDPTPAPTPAPAPEDGIRLAR
jgi:hypothetical protein